jgi:hypothetical protein
MEELNEILEVLNVEARELEGRIAGSGMKDSDMHHND